MLDLLGKKLPDFSLAVVSSSTARETRRLLQSSSEPTSESCTLSGEYDPEAQGSAFSGFAFQLQDLELAARYYLLVGRC